MAVLSELNADTRPCAASSSTSATASEPEDDPPRPSQNTRSRQPVEEASDDEDDVGNETSIWWSPTELQDIVKRSQELKESGNAAFKQQRWEAALAAYQEGIEELPVRTKTRAELARLKGKGRQEAFGKDDSEGGAEAATVPGRALAQEQFKPEGMLSVDNDDDMKEVSELRAALSANIAACCIKLERWKDAVEACDDALEEKPKYIKAIHRRAVAQEAIGSWASLQHSLEDFTALAQLEGAPPAVVKECTQAQARLPTKIKMQQEKEKDEMMSKLKDLGNMFLGKFGMSTDNFKLNQNENGGYSMNFEQ